MKTRIDTLLVEPSEIVRAGLTNLLYTDSSFSFLSPLSDAAGLEERVKALQPDLLILNPTLLVPPAKLQLVSVQQAKPNMAVVALVYQYVDPATLQLFRTVLDIREKGNRIAAILKDELSRYNSEAGDENYELSEREREVLILVAQGLSSKEIADRLCISIHTVNSHRKNLTHKTGIKSVAGLAVYAMLHNMA